MFRAFLYSLIHQAKAKELTRIAIGQSKVERLAMVPPRTCPPIEVTK
jgi:hypothetical protein